MHPSRQAYVEEDGRAVSPIFRRSRLDHNVHENFSDLRAEPTGRGLMGIWELQDEEMVDLANIRMLPQTQQSYVTYSRSPSSRPRSLFAYCGSRYRSRESLSYPQPIFSKATCGSNCGPDWRWESTFTVTRIGRADYALWGREKWQTGSITRAADHRGGPRSWRRRRWRCPDAGDHARRGTGRAGWGVLHPGYTRTIGSPQSYCQVFATKSKRQDRKPEDGSNDTLANAHQA